MADPPFPEAQEGHGSRVPRLQNQWAGVKGQEHHCRELPFPSSAIWIFTVSSRFLASTSHPTPTAHHQAPGSCPVRDAIIINTSSCFLPLSLQAHEQIPSLLPRAPPEQKGRRGTLRQRNVLAGYQETFFFFHTKP